MEITINVNVVESISVHPMQAAELLNALAVIEKYTKSPAQRRRDRRRRGSLRLRTADTPATC